MGAAPLRSNLRLGGPTEVGPFPGHPRRPIVKSIPLLRLIRKYRRYHRPICSGSTVLL